MAPELQAYYEARFDLFTTKGWKDLMEDAVIMRLSIENIENIKGLEDLKFKQGQLDILNWLLNLRKVSEEAYDELSKET